MILGIAYHSPIDVITLLPINTEISTNSQDDVDVLITDTIVDQYKAKIQLVFASSRVLMKRNLPILDHGPWGKILLLNSMQFEKLLCKHASPGIPDWVKTSH